MLRRGPVARAQSRLLIHRVERDWCAHVDALLAGNEKEAALTKRRKELREAMIATAPIAPPSAGGEEGCGATSQGNATENATGSLDSAATLPSEEGSGPAGATPCFPGGCLSDGDCGGQGDCVRGVCECNGGYLGASTA